MLEVNYRNEKRIMRVVGSEDITVDRKLSKLDIMALKAFPNSPIQKAIIAAREDVRAGRA